jgi:Septum formation
VAGPPTMTTKTPTPPPQYPQQYPSQDYPAPQGYPGVSAGSGGQGGPGVQGSQDNPWWTASPPPVQDLPSPYGPPPGSMGPPDQYSPVPGSMGPSGQYSPVPGSMGPPDQYSPVPAPSPRSRRKRPRWLLPVAVGAAAAGAVIAALVLSLSPHSSPSNATGARGTTSPSATPTVGNLSVAQLQVGDCLTGANLQLDNKDAPWPNLARAVPCSQPHTAEVFYANKSYWSKNSPYPGDAAIASASDTVCSNAFASYIGTSLNQSVYSVIKLVPVTSSWQGKDDRALHCVAYEPTRSQPGGAPLTSSIKGSAK